MQGSKNSTRMSHLSSQCLKIPQIFSNQRNIHAQKFNDLTQNEKQKKSKSKLAMRNIFGAKIQKTFFLTIFLVKSKLSTELGELTIFRP